MFEPEITGPPRKTRGELMRDVDADYYGYRDDDDGILEPLEKEAETIGIEKLEEELRLKLEEKGKTLEKPEEGEEEKVEAVKNYFIQVPSQEEIEQKILEHKKKQLLEMYVSPAITHEETEARELLGLQ